MNKDIKEGFLPCQNIHPDIILSDALVNNDMGKALVLCINTSDQEIKIDIPSVVVEEFDQTLEEYNGAEVINEKAGDDLERDQLVNTVFDLLYKKDLRRE